MGQVVEVRLPRKTRVVLMACFGVLAVLALGFAVVVLVRAPGVTAVPLAFAALSAAAAYRWSGLAVIAQGDSLRCRNLLRSRRVPRASIAAFRVGGSLWSTFRGNRAIHAVLTSGESVPLDVTAQPLHLRRREDQEACLRRLETWRVGD